MADQAATQAVEDQTEQQQNQDGSKTSAQSVEFPQASDTGNSTAATSIDILLDMNVPVTVAIGKTEMSIQQLLQLGPGSVLELAKPIDAPADLYLRDTRFATGSIVVVDDRFGIRINEILSTTVGGANKNN